MMKTLLLLAMLHAASLQSAAAGPRCIEQTEYEPEQCPLVLPPIHRITITVNAARTSSTDDLQVNCADFKLTDRLVRRYFSRAKLVPQGFNHAQSVTSPCYAEGTLTFKDGRHAQWSLYLYGDGVLTVGGQGPQTIYCQRCRLKPFAQ